MIRRDRGPLSGGGGRRGVVVEAMSQRSARLDTAAVLILILLRGIWGLQQVAAKVALRDGLPPVLQAGLRSAGATLLVWIWSMCRGVRLFEPDGSLVPGFLAALLFGLEFWALFRGLEYTTASRAVLLRRSRYRYAHTRPR